MQQEVMPDFAYHDEFHERVPLEHLIAQFMPLKRSMGEWRGNCPDPRHPDQDEVFFTSRGWYHCFGCLLHGEAPQFLGSIVAPEMMGDETPSRIRAAQRFLANAVGMKPCYDQPASIPEGTLPWVIAPQEGAGWVTDNSHSLDAILPNGFTELFSKLGKTRNAADVYRLLDRKHQSSHEKITELLLQTGEHGFSASLTGYDYLKRERAVAYAELNLIYTPRSGGVLQHAYGPLAELREMASDTLEHVAGLADSPRLSNDLRRIRLSPESIAAPKVQRHPYWPIHIPGVA